jgi:hypothetical protein
LSKGKIRDFPGTRKYLRWIFCDQKMTLFLPQGMPLGRKLSQFFFFFVWDGTLWALVTSPLRVFKEVRPDFGKALKGPEKTLVFFGKLKKICRRVIFWPQILLPQIFSRPWKISDFSLGQVPKGPLAQSAVAKILSFTATPFFDLMQPLGQIKRLN